MSLVDSAIRSSACKCCKSSSLHVLMLYLQAAGHLTCMYAGFPVTDPDARHEFYLYANWTYQAGDYTIPACLLAA